MIENIFKLKKIGSVFFVFVLLCMHSDIFAATNSIESITYQQLSGDRLQIAIKINGAPVDPLSFTTNNPARVALDFVDTGFGKAKKSYAVGIGAVTSINVASYKQRTRVVISMTEMLSYVTRVAGDTVYIELSTDSEESVSSAVLTTFTNTSSNAQAYKSDTSKVEPVARAVIGTDFKRGGKGEGRVIVELSTAGIPINVNQEGNKIVADFIDASVADSLVQRLDVIDFATPVKHFDITRTKEGARLVVMPISSEYEYLAYQSDNKFSVELKPITKEAQEAAAKSKFGYTGERLSLNFQDIEVRSVLQLIANFTGLNVVVSDTVGGTLTLRLKNVPWDQALDIILQTKGLDKRKSGNVLLIAPAEEIAAKERVALEAQQQVRELAPLKSEFFQINYAKAADIARLLRSDEGSEGSILSSRGTVTVDERTNNLLINDTAEVLENIRVVINRLDIPVKQVLIEARIVIASENYDKQLGSRFGITANGTAATSSDSNVIVSGTSSAIEELSGISLENAERLNFNFPATEAPSIAFGVTKLADSSLLELELSALEAEREGEVISTPRVITTDRREASIEQGVEIPYLEASASGAASVSFKKAVLSLTVTPQITPDETIILDLNVKQDSVGQISVGNNPAIDTREVTTQVAVSNGETVVLGGVFAHETQDTVNKIPFFGNLPILGRLFRQTIKREEKREILIFVTPKIIRDTLEFE